MAMLFFFCTDRPLRLGREKNIPTFLLHGHQVGGSLSRDDLGVRVETGLRIVRGELAVGGEH